MPLASNLIALLHAPTADLLWELRGDLLEAQAPAGSRVWAVMDHFHTFLEQLRKSATAREYSHLASLLDIGAVGGVVLEDLLHAEDASDLAEKLLGAVLSESLMILATRQHVKAWELEMSSVYESTSWYLYEELWRLSEALKPELDVEGRRRLVEKLLLPIRSPESPGSVRAVVIGRLFQWMLVASLAGCLKTLSKAGQSD